MSEQKIIGFQPNSGQREKLLSMASRTGMTVSQILRTLVDQAGVERYQAYRPTLQKHNSATTRSNAG